ncbi:hypothetical protein [Candidatus Aalborgicola defluviihabitans]|uniref:hypothetical protein n=1 Tax=Candidatus Aalborgicola defluviihabitans TaxID=3386187 RepID=UPI001ED46C78|nr:hypothetical protein [Burkholderiales bacterium]
MSGTECDRAQVPSSQQRTAQQHLGRHQGPPALARGTRAGIKLVERLCDRQLDYFSKTLPGAPLRQPRWKRCVALVDAQLGEALGQEFVARALGPNSKIRLW